MHCAEVMAVSDTDISTCFARVLDLYCWGVVFVVITVSSCSDMFS